MSRVAAQRVSAEAGLLHRQCACGGTREGEAECDDCKDKAMALHRKRNSSTVPDVPSSVYDVLSGSGSPLDTGSRLRMERRFHHDFSNVRVHADSRAGESANAVGAHAYTVGSHIVFAPGQYNPASSEGRRLIAHELAHVAQSGTAGSGGSLRVAPEGSTLEAEADRWGSQADQATQAAESPVVAPAPANTLHRDAEDETVPQRLQRQAKESAKLLAEAVVSADKEGYSGIIVTLANNGSGLIPGMAKQGEKGKRPDGTAPRDQSAVEHELLSLISVSVLDRPSDWTFTYKRNDSGYMDLNSWAGKDRPTPAPVAAPAPAAAAPTDKACFDGKTVTATKGGKSHSCPAFTDASAPTPEGQFCIRKQGDAQLAWHVYRFWRPDRAKWFLLEPQFATTRFRMDLHPGSVSKGCVTVGDKDCFSKLADVLNTGGSVKGFGYDGYPPGNSEGVKNPKKDVDCAAMLEVTSKPGGCATR